ncbi:FepA family TonB-dependent siderophore receptor [Chitinasiproducens palmae]|uniref:Ferric enterobactin receptor n=1 Tax=Chitinasiproducens palmae TaxID=1770053 RepID=A0A1H2PT45_9BURK|nr:ferric enterobactin receptor [Chitinasiproducens palmae]
MARTVLWAAVSGALGLPPTLAHAQVASAETEARHAFDIASGSLDQALRQFGQQAGATVSVSADVTAGLRSPAVHGSYTNAEALRLLLSRSRMRAVRDAHGEYTLEASPAPVERTAAPGGAPSAALIDDPEVGMLPEVVVVGTAEQASKQAPGASIITRDDIERRPPVNDLAEIIRTQPGVNLTGNSTSGQWGNNRQIDIRGMGPENTLILIDGKPVASRNSVRYGWSGERNTRGDTNWVPAQEVERIEIIRGPAAARYGSGAMGGVVNIVTKPPTDQWHGSVGIYADRPQHSVDGSTQRATFDLSGPLSDRFFFRLYGNANKTGADAYNINQGHTTPRSGTQAGTYPAGREGVRNRDVSGRLTWKLTPDQTIDFDASYSRQGNIYAGDTQNTNNFSTSNTGALATTSQRVLNYLGAETNIMYRENYAATYNGKFDFGTVKAYLQYAKTRNERLEEGLSGGVAGLFASDTYQTAVLQDYTAHLETNLPLKTAGVEHVLTLGTEWTLSTFTDPGAVTQSTSTGGSIAGVTQSGRSDRMSSHTKALFAEDNIAITDNTILTPGLRFDDNSAAGPNWSPSLNLSHALSRNWTVKAGIARAYKTPNLYQLNPNYLLYSSGNGCWGVSSACYLMGNASLKAESSVNKEVGVEYSRDGLLAGITFFRNDYHNKIDAGLAPVGNASGGNGAYIYQWTNVSRALVQGWEGTFRLPISASLDWSNNLTYMITSKNKETGERLSIIPKYTLNSTLDWRATSLLSMQATLTWYGNQAPKKYDYQGNPVVGYAGQQRASYALVGLSGSYQVKKNLRLGFGVHNIFDRRLYREGNASGTSNGANVISGAGAATYNEPGRSFWASLTASF